MNDVSRQSHWEKVYATKGESEFSWFQETPVTSLELIRLAGAIRTSGIIDIGGGAPPPADRPGSQGFGGPAGPALSAQALASARAPMGDNAHPRTWAAAHGTIWRP